MIVAYAVNLVQDNLNGVLQLELMSLGFHCQSVVDVEMVAYRLKLDTIIRLV